MLSYVLWNRARRIEARHVRVLNTEVRDPGENSFTLSFLTPRLNILATSPSSGALMH